MYNNCMSKKTILYITLTLILITLCIINVTNINPKQLSLRKEVIKDQIGTYENDILIAYFSDICFNQNMNKQFLENLVDDINKYHPDIIIYGGDLIDNEYFERFNPEERQLLIDNVTGKDIALDKIKKKINSKQIAYTKRNG